MRECRKKTPIISLFRKYEGFSFNPNEKSKRAMPNSDGISKISLLSCRSTFTKKYPAAMNPIEMGNDNNLHKNPDMRAPVIQKRIISII